MNKLEKIGNQFKKSWVYIFNGHFIVSLVRWMTVTSGNVGESAFLLATLWVIVNAVGHVLLTWMLSTHTIELINYLALIAFSALPELMIIPVIATCFSHWVLFSQEKNKSACVWAILYTIPSVIFLIMTILTITMFVSTGGNSFAMASGWQIVIRCLSGWMYAAVNMLFQKLGEPHYASRMTTKDAEIERLKAELERQKTEIETELNGIKSAYSIERHELLIELNSRNEQINQLAERASSLNREPLLNYPIVAIDWMENGKRTVSIDELISATGVTRQKIASAIRSGKIQKDNRNKDLLRVSSVVEWLKTVPLPATVIVAEETNELPESNRKTAKIIEFHSPNIYSPNGA